MSKILIIDDEKAIRNTMRDILQFESHEVDVAENGLSGLEKIKNDNFSIVFLDIKMQDMDGIQCLSKILEENANLPVVMISGHGNIKTAVECIKKGATDYIEKPIDLNILIGVIKNILSMTDEKVSKPAPTPKNTSKQNSKNVGNYPQIIGDAESVHKIRAMIDRIATTDARVMITGENGTGKEIVARNICRMSHRANAPFIEVNCAAIPSELIESELFGHEKGSFTSAIKTHTGKFEQANNGTIFLDEVADMSLLAQAKVLRCLQENTISPVGSDKLIKVNVRVISATNKDLKKEIEKGNFREDLFHRLNVINIHMPSLRERKEDIPLFVEAFRNEIINEQHTDDKVFTKDALDELKKYHWSGNIRELKNVVERLIILCDAEITAKDVKRFITI
ncbi:MAG: sigma-54 dependent transcriptional regulator [Prevotellaceae bacterium]|jgi:DNA-binding NtrC family response regulator|nr:sigma-54 dependent transcriptional regulator [Prevotellaceae bacterium]